MKFKPKIFLVFLLSGIFLTAGGVAWQYYNAVNLLLNEISGHLRTLVSDKGSVVENFLNEKKGNIGVVLAAPDLEEQFKENNELYKQISVNEPVSEITRVAENLNKYIKENNLSAYDLLSDKEFQQISVINIRGSFTSVLESDKMIFLAHSRNDLIGQEIAKSAGDNKQMLNVLSRAQSGKTASGIYEDSLGNKKFLYALPVTQKTAVGLSMIVLWETDLSNLANSKGISEEMIKYMDIFASRYAYDEVFLVTDSGNVFWASKNSNKLNLNFLAEDLQNEIVGKTIKKAGEQKKVIISSVENSENEASAYFYSIAPVIEKDKVIGYIGLKFSGRDIFNIINNNATDKKTVKSFLVDDEHILLSPLYTQGGKIINKKIDDQGIKNCFKDEVSRLSPTVESYTDFLNKTVEGAYYPLKNTNWCVISEIDKSEALAPGTELLLSGFLIGGVIIVLVILISLVFSTRISRPLERLTEEVEKVEAGNLKFETSLNTKDEIGDLERAFKKMVTNLSGSRSDAEKMVQIQTEEMLKQRDVLEKQQKAVLNILEDIHDEKEKLSQEKDKINTILLSIGDGVFVVDRDKRIIVFNQIASDISGFSYDEVVGKKYRDVLRFEFEKDNTENTSFVDDAFAKGKIQNMKNHTVLIRKDGIKVPVADSAAPLKNSDGNIIGCVVVFRDVTKEREVDKMKSEFISVASHQLKTPITGIRWFAEFLLKGDAGPLNKDQMEFVRQINDSNDRMVVLVNDLLNVSRIETGRKFVIEKTPTDLIKLVKEVVKENEALSARKKVKVELLKGTKEECIMNIDAQKVWQVFNNLISNAIKYSRENGHVKVSCLGVKSNKRIFCVEDDGIGIPKEQQKRVFERFFRADNAISMQTDGTGLGLYIARSIIEAHGGKLWFESIEGKGSKFFFSLPVGTEKNSLKKIKKEKGGNNKSA